MSPDRFAPDETELAVEELVVKKNGKTKTANDVFEVLVAMHHDSKKRDAIIISQLEKHCEQFVHFEEHELEEYVKPFRELHKEKEADISHIEHDILELKENCKALHQREPRRSTDPPTENWGTGLGKTLEDEEMGDIRRVWRVLKWVVIVASAPLLVALGNKLASLIWG